MRFVYIWLSVKARLSAEGSEKKKGYTCHCLGVVVVGLVQRSTDKLTPCSGHAPRYKVHPKLLAERKAYTKK